MGRNGHFRRSTARARGLSDGRLVAADLTRISHGLYRRADQSPRPWSLLGLVDPAHGLAPDTLAALMDVIGCTVSHQTAAHLYGVPLPRPMAEEPDIHVTSTSPGSRSRRPGIRCHRTPLRQDQITVRAGIPVVTPERMWLDLASVVDRTHIDALVIAGDHLVKSPWWDGRRVDPLTTIELLQSALDHAGSFKGVRLARAALPQVRVGADSGPETSMRLALVRAGLPEPVLQFRPPQFPSGPYSADAAYPEWKIALQYDGSHHRTPEQQSVDARRDAWFQSRGWLVIRVTSHDLREGFRRVIRAVQDRAAAGTS